VGFEPWSFSSQESSVSADPAGYSVNCLHSPLFTLNRFSRKINNLPAYLLWASGQTAAFGEMRACRDADVAVGKMHPARVVRWLNHLDTMCSRAWRALCAVGSRFNSSHGPGKARPPGKSNYVKIIPTHMIIREIIPGGNRGFDGVYKMWPLLAPWLAASRGQSCWCRLKW